MYSVMCDLRSQILPDDKNRGALVQLFETKRGFSYKDNRSMQITLYNKFVVELLEVFSNE